MTCLLLNGNALHIPLATGSVQCVITSPPYWGLRDYGLPPTIWDGDPKCIHQWVMNIKRGHNGGKNSPKTKIKGTQNFQTTPDSTYAVCSRCHAWYGTLGLEPTPKLYVEHLVTIFREIRRVLRPDGTTWLNLGDSYANIGHPKGNPGNGKAAYASQEGIHMRWEKGRGTDLKHKDLVGIPWMVAFALRADGWHLRSDVIWHKPNPMPESVTDRPTKAHEYVFLLTKSKKYFYDADAIKEPASASTHARISQDLMNQVGSFRANGGQKSNGPMKAVIAGSTRKLAEAASGIKSNKSFDAALSMPVEIVNKRSVWTIPTQSYSGAHFATFPERLVEPMLLAGTSSAGCCPQCGAPYKRTIESVKGEPLSYKSSAFNHGKTKAAREFLHPIGEGERTIEHRTVGWRPTCKCNAGEPIPCLVLDPFAGTATVGRVAIKHHRRFIGVDLKPAYLALARDRTTNVQIAIPITD